MPAPLRVLRRCGAASVDGGQDGVGIQQQVRYRGMAVLRSEVERRPLGGVGGIDVGICLDQAGCHRVVAAIGGIVECSPFV